MRIGFWLGNLRERDRLEDPGVDGRVTLKCVFKKRNMGVDCYNVAQG